MYVYIHAHSLSRTGARSTALPAAAGGPCIALAFAEPFCRPCALVCFAILPSLCIVLLLMCARRARRLFALVWFWFWFGLVRDFILYLYLFIYLFIFYFLFFFIIIIIIIIS